ncbi:hypothetical protein BGW36DRAFT_290215 [Talaromyces proteolyticus]|uniref:THIF-type NAD/FAD binding fold domain-containing protein n=1 Tax=Talaromyces proteolyticus TaxID=1131652 RepID=A0AAD4L0F3_9EURO|nr:uncharacterized protein BGW36DRAFT_290215 [Talaromyces proteolyticus]KAH8701831.1 hypothetical protein BGW36DRAFT_290215 [Talaromyces proteolyticus]
MSSWLQRQAGSHNVQLAAAAVLSGAAVAAGIFGFQSYQRREAVERLKKSIPGIDERHHAEVLTEYGTAGPLQKLSPEDERSAALARRAQQGDYDEDLILEQLARNRVFLTDDGLAKLRSSFIVVVGCGGVGSHATVALARSGVSKIRLIDFDQVTLSSLNRHAVATLADVGTPKVQCIRRRLEQIVPWVQLDCRNELYGADVSDRLLAPWSLGRVTGQKPDYVIDCIDNIDSKVELLQYCHSNKIPVISSMGAGCKSDPTCIGVADISASTEDPLSRATRRRLRLLGVSTGIPVVFSTEKPGPGKASLLPLPEEEFAKGKVGELGVLPDFRVRILPVLGTMPAVFGYTIANHVICHVSNYPIDYSLASKGKDGVNDTVFNQLRGLIERLVRAEDGNLQLQGMRLPLSRDDVGYMLDEIWRGRSAISGLPSRLALVPWERPATGFRIDPQWEREGQKLVRVGVQNLVCMTKEESARHEREVLRGGKRVEDVYDEKQLQSVRARLKEAEIYERNRVPQASSCIGRRPLIDYVKNSWDSSSSQRRTSSISSSSSSEFHGPQSARHILSMISAPKFRRYLIVYVILVVSFYFGWNSYLQPMLEERAGLVRALDVATMNQAGGWFGTNTRPEFADMVPIRSLDPALLPASEKAVLVERLLEKVSFNRENGDHLVFTGDLIHKGPDSSGVVDIARGLQASCVRGNHEDRILLLRSQMKIDNTFNNPEKDYNQIDISQRKVARELSDEQALWLQQCPVILKIGQVSGMGDVVVVHGGLVPGVNLDRQDLSSVMTMRSIDSETHVPSAKKEDGLLWTKLFNKYQELLSEHIAKSVSGVYGAVSRTTTVVYGHDSSTSLNIQRYTKGLDSGCVYGRKLSALVIENGGKNKIVQVKCNKYMNP